VVLSRLHTRFARIVVSIRALKLSRLTLNKPIFQICKEERRSNLSLFFQFILIYGAVMVKITGIIKNSPAYHSDMRENDVLVSINGHNIADVLDYMFYAAEDFLKITLLRNNEEITVDVKKGEYDDLGLEFDSFLMDKKQSCSNKCVFCFIDQMPKGMRETLYFKDDDARLSFLQGNYVTLTNLSQQDIDRIINMKLNINVSVHTTNPQLRCTMMNNRFAGEKLKYLKQMTDSGIKLNCQIVLCPELNDGDELRRTLTDLGNMMPNITSIAVVPVGLSKFRDGLYPLKSFDKNSSSEAIDIIEEFQNKFLEKYGSRKVFLSDEFFLSAERELPDFDYYEDFSQYENGVGMLRSITDEFEKALEIAEFDGKRSVSIATGYSPFEQICKLASLASDKWENLDCSVYKIRNDFFGETITVTGLITATDLIAQLKGKELGDELLISSSMLRRDSDVFLDDLTVSDVEKALNVKIKAINNDGYELLDAILGIEF
jgi:putative radical SAM enzyme (TIGR03279 family)